MAEMLVDGAKLDACNTAEADAIRAKTGGSSPIPYDYANNKGFADAIASIQTGGGSLPSVISKIDGGEFTFASERESTYRINHTLGVTPKGFVIWTDDVDLSTVGNYRCIRGVFIVDETADGSTTSYLYQLGTNNNNFSAYGRPVGANYSGYANSNYISYNVSNIIYVAGATYKWFAWA